MTDLMLSLQITALGMGLVFGAILLLWLMMVLLNLFTAEKETKARSTGVALSPEVDFKAQAAAVAVAFALGAQGLSSAHPLPEPPTAIVSAWQLGMRTRQMSEKRNFRRPNKE